MFLFFKRYKIKSYEMGLYFRDGEFRAGAGWIPSAAAGSGRRARE